MSERFEMRVPEGLLDRVDSARGFESRASFVRRTLESALGASDRAESGNLGGSARLRQAGASVSSRAPVEKGFAVNQRTGEVLNVEGRPNMGPPALQCPMPGCDFTAKSPAAKCSVHGRTVR